MKGECQIIRFPEWDEGFILRVWDLKDITAGTEQSEFKWLDSVTLIPFNKNSLPLGNFNM